MSMKISSDVYIKLTEEDLEKLEVIDCSFEEEVSRKTMIKGGIDLMFATALEILHREEMITQENLENGMEMLPDYLAERVMANTSKE